MTADDIKSLCVVGAGFMGSQIAAQAALHGYPVANVDVDRAILDRARESVAGHLRRRVEKGKLSQADFEAAMGRISYTTDLEAAAAGADFVVEAVIEDLDEKKKVFATLDRVCPPHAVLATNSSTIVNSLIAPATRRPDKVINMHFFSPALVMELVEVVMSEATSDETAEVTMELARRMGKTPVLLRREISGFVVNRILGVMTDEALRLYEAGIAHFKDIDMAVKKGLGHPMGPFELMDFTGIDVNYRVRMQRYRETGDPQDLPARTVREKYERGEWGRKSGRGFYDYPKPG